jgi:hypothetical protein
VGGGPPPPTPHPQIPNPQAPLKYFREKYKNKLIILIYLKIKLPLEKQ